MEKFEEEWIRPVFLILGDADMGGKSEFSALGKFYMSHIEQRRILEKMVPKKKKPPTYFWPSIFDSTEVPP